MLVRDGRIVATMNTASPIARAACASRRRRIYHYGSITKTLTAIAIMQLRDRGRLSLDDRITTYIPELRQVHDPYGSMDA